MNSPPYDKGSRALSEFILAEMARAIESDDWSEQELLVTEAENIPDAEVSAETLNKLLVTPGHQHHQGITRAIQKLGNPSSIPYIRKMLDSKFEALEYTCSEHAVIAKWFSHALADINTAESIQMIREYANSDDPGLAEEMNYRLGKLGPQQIP
jgi:HEAT repeat protein